MTGDSTPGAGRSTVGMFLSRSSSFSFKDGDALAKACSADVKKFCGALQTGDGFVRRLTSCLRTNEKSLSAACRNAIKDMRHEKHGDDACAGACACDQTCVADDDDHGDKDKDKDKGGNSLRTATSSRDAKDDGDHDDDDLRCEGACPAGMVSCHGKCVDLENDPLNCGYCDNQCQGKLGDPCVKRQCQKACKGQPGLVDCGEVCADIKTDANNCGACGIVCGCGQVCNNGACVAAAGCPPGQNQCNGACVPNNDPNACGPACTVCPQDPNNNGVPICVAGVCSLACPPGTILAGGACVGVGGLHSNLPSK